VEAIYPNSSSPVEKAKGGDREKREEKKKGPFLPMRKKEGKRKKRIPIFLMLNLFLNRHSPLAKGKVGGGRLRGREEKLNHLLTFPFHNLKRKWERGGGKKSVALSSLPSNFLPG